MQALYRDICRYLDSHKTPWRNAGAFYKLVFNMILASLLVEFAATIPVGEHEANVGLIRQFSEVPRSRRSGAQRYSALHSDLDSQCFAIMAKSIWP